MNGSTTTARRRAAHWAAFGVAWAAAVASAPPAAALDAGDVGVIVNVEEPLSLAIADYYVARRRIPARNVVQVRFPAGRAVLDVGEFQRAKEEVDRKLPASVQLLALTWARPYQVDCLSITSAFALGFDSRGCAVGCRPTATSVYFDSASRWPWQDFRFRPAMSIAARDYPQAKALIERGIASDGTQPAGTAYLLDTSDRARNARVAEYSGVRAVAGRRLRVEIVHADALTARRDILLYATGVMNVRELGTNRFLPGAVGDHLTSFGGQLFGSNQMSSLRWLEAGATASYGTVVEPCAFPGKFPNPAVLLKHYLAGETVAEAYWKSVLMPGQGLFIGEPLARPFGARAVERS